MRSQLDKSVVLLGQDDNGVAKRHKFRHAIAFVFAVLVEAGMLFHYHLAAFLLFSAAYVYHVDSFAQACRADVYLLLASGYGLLPYGLSRGVCHGYRACGVVALAEVNGEAFAPVGHARPYVDGHHRFEAVYARRRRGDAVELMLVVVSLGNKVDVVSELVQAEVAVAVSVAVVEVDCLQDVAVL